MFKKFGKAYDTMPASNYMVKSSKLVNEFVGFVKVSGRHNFDYASDLPIKLAHLNTYFLILTH